jgi:C1A family cysteine protease
MQRVDLRNFGWHPDLADHRDYTLDHEVIAASLSKLKMRTRKPAELPTSMDWREYCGPVEDQQELATSAAHACVALIQQFERRSSGRMLRLSRLFAHCAARRLVNVIGDQGVSLRSVFKAIALCGVPPEEYWPYDSLRLEAEPDPFTYAFHRDFRTLCYLRLDSRLLSGEQVLDQLRSFLAAGFPFAFGFPVCSSVGNDSEIPFPTAADTVLGGQAVTAVGYDDRVRIRSDKGALLVRNSWGPEWGDHGFGWLPYTYVKQQLARDFWTLLKPSWLRSGEFELPHS